jgi:NAD(P)H dehydrogenase (quinone)
MIVITGATGALNGATADQLVDRLGPTAVAVVTRDAAKAARFADRGVEVRVADYADPSSLPATFEGAEQLLLVSSNEPTGDHVALHGNAIAAAQQVGVGRILYTSHQGAHPDTPFHPGVTHAATEELLAASGLPWTSLRNGFYAHSLVWLAGPWRETGTISVPGDGPVSWTAREDAAAAAAVILAEGGFDGPVTLTAPQAPTFADLTAPASEFLGREVTLEVLDPQDWVAQQIAGGRPEQYARFMLGFYEAAAGGFFAGTDPLLGKLIGRTPRTAAEVLLSEG